MSTDITVSPAMERLPESARRFLDHGHRGLFIDGEFVDPVEGGHIPVVDPTSGLTIAEVAAATAPDVDHAVDVARAAFANGWGSCPPAERAKLLWRLGDLVDEHRSELAALESLDTGKPLAVAERFEVPMAAETLRYFAGWSTKLEGSSLPPAFPYPAPQRIESVRRPVGVVGAITPWNAPLMMQIWKLAPALACGNAVLHKPAEQTSLTALRMAELIDQAGFPPGAVAILTGFGDTAGAALVRHPDVDKIAFTGSTAVGQEILRVGADSLKRVSLELGGKSPFLVFADAAEADLDRAAKAAALAIYTNSGQVCAAGSRLLVERAVQAEMVERVAANAQRLKLGGGLDPETRMGPLISQEQLDLVLGFVDQGVAEGSTLVTGGQRADEPDLAAGYFVRPTVFDAVEPGSVIWREEIFGPVVGVTPFDDADHAVALANDTPYGLAAGIFTTDLARAYRLAPRIRAGTVWINTYNLYDPAVPWGGFGASGIGRENGTAALELFTERQTIWTGL